MRKWILSMASSGFTKASSPHICRNIDNMVNKPSYKINQSYNFQM
jgi:hypothetical protein